MFISSKSYLTEVKKITQGLERLDIAVAFWGEGSDELILQSTNKMARIVCNLASGGTNPGPIRRLIDRKVQVRQLDELHAKVIVGDNSAIVGSANLSTNGLQLEAGESTGWTEAGVLVHSADELRDISEWFEAIWERTRAIAPSDLDKAEEAWKLRRLARPKTQQAETLFDLSPREVKDRRIFLLIWSEGASEGANEAFDALISQAQQQGVLDHVILNKLSFYEDLAEVPDDATIISFQRHAKGKYSCDGIWQRKSEFDVPASAVHAGLQIVFEKDQVLGIKTGRKKDLEKVLRPVLDSLLDEFEGKYGGAMIPFDRVLEKLGR
jgi:hypothetical protein